MFFSRGNISNIALLAGLLTAISGASAQELQPTNGFDWSGPYIGADAGGLFINNTLLGDQSGVIGGVIAGYRNQFGSFVYGQELDVTLGDVSRKFTTTISGQTLTATQSLNYGATARLQFGYLAGDLLFFGTAGIALGNMELAGAYGGTKLSDSATHVGYVVGGGLEIPFTQNISGRLEYQYSSFGSATYHDKGLSLKLSGTDAHLVRAAVV